MIMIKCRFSGSAEIPQQNPNRILLPVECPECGAIRRPVTGWQEIPQTFGNHNELEGSAKGRKRYKKINGEWQIVED